jgi:hypothetical protein
MYDVVAAINDSAQRALMPVYLQHKNGALTVRSESEMVLAHTLMWRNERVRRLDYVLPAAIQDEPLQLELPLTYLFILSIITYLNWKSQSDSVAYPEVHLDLAYSDIGSHGHKIAYVLIFQVFMMGATEFRVLVKPRVNAVKE